jgi:uncharacterized membrane protein HdeD (DUF308 family)
MWRVFGGAALVIAGIAAFIEARSHRTRYGYNGPEGPIPPGAPEHELLHGHLSQTGYDLLRIGGWALVIFGALLVIVGLIAYWGAQTRRPAP